MRVAHAILADFAMAHDQDGKLYVTRGGLRSLEFPGFPATYPKLALAVGLDLEPDELGAPHQVRIEAHGPSGEPIVEPRQIALQVPPGIKAPAYFHFVYNMEKVAFPVEGDYGFAISIDGVPAHDVPLRVSAIPGLLPAAVQANQLLGQGYRAFTAGDIAGAAAIFKQVTERFPQEPTGPNNLGFALLALGEASAALDAFRKAAELGYVQNEISDANVACVLYVTGDMPSALRMFADCLRTHIFRTPATLFGIGPSGLFPVQLNSAVEYVSLMAMNAAWSAFGNGDTTAAAHYLDAARAAELSLRGDGGAQLFGESVRTLAARTS